MSKKLILSDRLYVPERYVDDEALEAFTYEFVPLNAGRRQSDGGEDEAPVEVCETFNFSKKSGLYGFHRGNLAKLRKVFHGLDWTEARTLYAHGYDLKFTGSLYEDQLRAGLEWITAGSGILNADTGWGKNVVLTWLIVALKQRSIVFGDTCDLVKQMYEEFVDKTNLRKLEKRHGIALAGVLHEQAARKFFPIVTFATYQTFLDRWKANRKYLSKQDSKLGFAWLNECHIAAAPGISKVFGSLSAAYRGGDTATPERKDGRELITFDLVGPVVARGKVESSSCSATFVRTGIRLRSNITNWNTIINNLTTNEKRNALIVERVTKEVEGGHCVLVLTDRVAHAKLLADMIHFEGFNVASYFGGNRYNEENKEGLKNGSIDVLVAVSKMTQKGFNVPRLSSLHLVTPMNNRTNLRQRSGRIRRIYLKCKKCEATFTKRLVKCPDCDKKLIPGKPNPIITYYLDDNNDILYRCAAACGAQFRSFEFSVNSDKKKPGTATDRSTTVEGFKKFGGSN